MTAIAKPTNDYHTNIRADVLPHVPAHGGTLLDLGGGVGATALAAKNAGLADNVGVVDFVDPLSGLDFSYRGDLNNLEFLSLIGREQGPFRTILCLDILEHLLSPWDVVAQLHQMLEPGGVIVTSIPNVRHISVVLPLIARGSWNLKDEGVLDRTHLRFFTESSAVELMVRSGLRHELTSPLYDGGKATKLFGWMPFALIRDFSVLQYVIRVKRM